MTIELDLKQMARLAGDAAALAEQGKAAEISDLVRELARIAAAIPTKASQPVSAHTAEEEERRRAADAEIEAAFDNLPI